jgi:membrane protease YdiL (CAAX protease family)
MTPDPEPPRPQSTFSLEGRPAAGLYLFAWLLTGLGLGMFIIALQAGGGQFGGLLLIAALVLLGPGLALAAGYQVVARATRPPPAFRGPSPAILLGLQIVLSAVIGSILLFLGAPDPLSGGAGFLVISFTLFVSHVTVVWLFGIRSGALGWPDLGLPRAASASRVLGDIGMGFVTMIVAWPIVTALTVALALLLNSRPPDVLPVSRTATDILLIALGAGILVPIGEEMLFRGYSLTAWLRDLGPRSALVRSTIFFAFAHVLNVTSSTFDEGARQALLTVVVITPVGAVLGWLFLRRGLVASMAGHATFNLIGVLVVALADALPQGPGLPGS